MRNKITALLLMLGLTAQAQWLGMIPNGAAGAATLVPPTNTFYYPFAGNPIANTNGAPAAYWQNAVYDSVSQLWVNTGATANSVSTGTIIVYTNGVNPLIPGDWGWASNTPATNGYGVNIESFPPRLFTFNGSWFCVGNIVGYTEIGIASNTTPFGPWTNWALIYTAAGSGFETQATEPFVFQQPNGTWRLVYTSSTASAGSEVISTATSSNMRGTYTAYASNPLIPNTLWWTNNISDSWVVYINGTYYIGHATALPPAGAAVGGSSYDTTTDWVNVTKGAMILQSNVYGWNGDASFRGGVSLVGRSWCFPFTGVAGAGQSGYQPFELGVASCPSDNGAPNISQTNTVLSDLHLSVTFNTDINACCGAVIANSSGAVIATNAENYPSNIVHTVTFYGLTNSTTYIVTPLATNMIASASVEIGPPMTVTTTTTNTDTSYIARWLFTNGSGTTLTDSSGNGYHGTFGGTPFWLLPHGAFFPAPSLTYVNIPSNAVPYTSNLTYSIWFNWWAIPQGTGMFGPDADVQVNGRYGIYSLGINYGAEYQNSVGGHLVTDTFNMTNYANTNTMTNYANTNWHNLTVVIDRSYTFYQTVYVDGVTVATNTIEADYTPGNIAGGITNVIGCRVANSKTAPEEATYFNGGLDDARVWNRALTSNEIVNVIKGYTQPTTTNTPSAPLTSSLGLWWSFDSTTITDLSGNGNTGILGGSTHPYAVNGVITNAFNFNNNTSSSWVTVGAAPVSSFPLTITGWFQFSNSATGGAQDLICINNLATEDSIAIELDNTTFFDFVANHDQSQIQQKNWAGLSLGTTWHMMTGVFVSASSNLFYLDGTNQTGGSIVHNFAPTPVGLNSTTVGKYLYNSGSTFGTFAGNIDDPRIYSSALTQAQIVSIYESGLPGLLITNKGWP